MIEFLIYAFLITGTLSFVAELIWRIINWKEKATVVNYTINSTDKLSATQALDKIVASVNKKDSGIKGFR